MLKACVNREERPALIVPIETKVREYHGKLLFAAYAARAGHSVVLGDQNELLVSLSRLPRAVYLDKSVTVSKEAWFRRLEAFGNLPAGWDEEGLVVRSYDVYREARLNPQSVERLRCFLTWGRRHRDAVLQRFPHLAPVVHATGSPRFDLLRPEWRRFHQPAVDAIRREHGTRLLLVNTNHAFANHYRGKAGVSKLLDKYPLGSQSDFQRGWFAFQQRNLDLYKAIIPALCRAFPQHTIIVRPSPSENHAMWTDFLRDLPHARMSARGNVHPWILAAEAVVHFNCTTGVEAYLLDKPAIAVRAETNDAYEAELPKALSRHASGPDEVVALVRDADRLSPKEDPARRRTAAEFMEGLEGPTASERALTAIAGLSPPPPGPRPWYDRLRFRLSDLRAAREAAAIQRASDAYERQKFPGLEPSEVGDDLKRFADIDDSFASIAFARIGRALYRIDRK
jgi:surface carbohydrate biosynthesis protein